MNNIKEVSLKKALETASLRDLPLPWKESKGFWIDAVLLVRKQTLDTNYVLATRDGRGVIHYVQDFGRMSQIIGVLGIYPYLYLDNKFVDIDDEKAKRRAIIDYFPEGCPREVREKAYSLEDGPELDVLLRDAAIHLQHQNRDIDVAANLIEEREPIAFETESRIETLKDIADPHNLNRGYRRYGPRNNVKSKIKIEPLFKNEADKSKEKEEKGEEKK